MIIERNGPIRELTPRIQRFLVEALEGKSVDDHYSHELERPDYLCCGDRLIIELKTLALNADVRLGNLIEQFRQRDDWPDMIGPAPLDACLRRTSEPKRLMREVEDCIGNAIRHHLGKANRQIRAHRQRNGAEGTVGIVVFANEDHEIYDPNTVTSIVARYLRRQTDGKPIAEDIDLVIFLTERHGVVFNGMVTHSVISIEAPSAISAPWKAEYGHLFSESWAKWNGIPLVSGNIELKDFIGIDVVPDKAPRSDWSRINYRRQPYLQGVSDVELRKRFDNIMVILTSAHGIGSPYRPSADNVNAAHEAFVHVTMELGQRGISRDQVAIEPGRIAQAAIRLRLPLQSVGWLADFYRDR